MKDLEKLPMEQILLKSMQQSIEQEVGYLWERKKKEIVEEIDRKKSEAIAGIALHIMNQIDMRTLEDRLVITLKKDI